jgi:hypothetical protein
MRVFQPTYLYVKQHKLTKKLYFGKTTRNDPERYLGSGLHWRRHLKVHGKQHVVTLWTSLFTIESECTEFAVAFSEVFDIVESDQWLNLIVENGIGGKAQGSTPPEEARRKMSLARLGKPPPNKGKPHTSETRARMSAASPWRGKQQPKDAVAKRSQTRRGMIRPKVICTQCGKCGDVGTMHRWHFDRCKWGG